jgi:hypothetical protein
MLAARREWVFTVAVAGLYAAVKALDDELDALLAGKLAAMSFGLGFGGEGGERRDIALVADLPASAVRGYFDGGHDRFEKSEYYSSVRSACS